MHPELIVTGLYNVLAKLRGGDALTDREREVHDRGLIGVLHELHERLDGAVFAAYGWPADLSDEDVLSARRAERERAEEE